MSNKRNLVFKGRYAVLDEHSLPPTSKHPGITVDADRLRLIADNNNKRIKETGDATPLVLGHTDDDAYEVEQPPVVGFADNFSVQPLFNTGRQAIWADFHFYEDKLDEAKHYPRRSVELWASKNLIDPISLLSASTPERDLGLMKFSKQEETPYHYSLTEELQMPDNDVMPDKKPKKTGDKKADDDKVKEGAKEDVSPELVQAVVAALMQTPMMKSLEELVMHLSENAEEEEEEEEEAQEPKHQNASPPPQVTPEAAKFNEPSPFRMQDGGAMPSGTNTFVPSTVKDKKEYEMSDDIKLKYEALENKLNALAAENAAIKQMNEKIVMTAKQEHAARQYEALKAEGYELDDRDLKMMSNMQIESQKQHAEVIRKKYRKAPVKTGLADLVQYSHTGNAELPNDNATAQKVAEFAIKNGLTFEEAKLKYSASK